MVQSSLLIQVPQKSFDSLNLFLVPILSQNSLYLLILLQNSLHLILVLVLFQNSFNSCLVQFQQMFLCPNVVMLHQDSMLFLLIKYVNLAHQCGPRVVITLPFELKFLTPAIKICAGCRKGYPRAPDGKSCLPAPKDLCLVHKEQHMYYNVVNCKQQLSLLTNVHYHANSSCPKARFPDFNQELFKYLTT